MPRLRSRDGRFRRMASRNATLPLLGAPAVYIDASASHPTGGQTTVACNNLGRPRTHCRTQTDDFLDVIDRDAFRNFRHSRNFASTRVYPNYQYFAIFRRIHRDSVVRAKFDRSPRNGRVRTTRHRSCAVSSYLKRKLHSFTLHHDGADSPYLSASLARISSESVSSLDKAR